ncbi:MAG: hypothetical protein QXV17_08925 [Candidatus Micrarchaeaceae archaeon]
MTEEEFKAKTEEYLKGPSYSRRYENRVRQRIIRELIDDMYGDYKKLQEEEFIKKYNWTQRLLFEKPLEPVEDRGDNVLNNIERYHNGRLLNYGTGDMYYLGPTFVYYMLNLARETERIKKEGERRKKILNEIDDVTGKTSDIIKKIIDDMNDLYDNYNEYDEETKIEKLTLNVSNLLAVVGNLFNNSIDMRNLLDEDNHRLDKIEKIVASIAPVMEHLTKKTDESYARALDLEEEVDKLDSDIMDVRTDARIAAIDASYAASMVR